MATPLYNSGLCFITGVVSEHTTQWQLNWDTVCKHNIVEVSAIGKFMISLHLDQVLDTVGIQYVLTKKSHNFIVKIHGSWNVSANTGAMKGVSRDLT